jgi:hypothetical protein
VKKSHRVIVSIIASMGLSIATAHAHPGGMGGGMGPGMMGPAGPGQHGNPAAGAEGGKTPAQQGRMGHHGAMSGHGAGMMASATEGHQPMAGRHATPPTQNHSH